MDAESYADAGTAELIHQHFVPVEAHIKEHPAWFKRFDAVWTPTVILLDSDGKERVRLEGYLTHRNFDAWLRCGLGRLAFVRKKFPEAEGWYGEVATQLADSHFAAEATYYRGLARYSSTHDHGLLKALAAELQEKYPGTVWAEKSIPWG